MNLKEKEKQIVMSIEADKVTSRGSYPAIGKTVGMTHDYLIKKNPDKNIISLGLGPLPGPLQI